MKLDFPAEVPDNMKERLKASYDAMAPAYNDWTGQRHNHLRATYLESLTSLLPKLTDQNASPKVLEIGCGNGKPFLHSLLSNAGKGATAIANDLSDTQINLAKENLKDFGDRVTFSPGDMTKLDFPDGSLTAVIGLYSIIHLPGEEQVSMFRKIVRWLEPGGCLLFNFSAEEMEYVVMDEWIDEKGWMFWSGFGQGGTVERLKEVGLEVVLEKVENDEQGGFVWVVARVPSLMFVM